MLSPTREASKLIFAQNFQVSTGQIEQAFALSPFLFSKQLRAQLERTHHWFPRRLTLPCKEYPALGPSTHPNAVK